MILGRDLMFAKLLNYTFAKFPSKSDLVNPVLLDTLMNRGRHRVIHFRSQHVSNDKSFSPVLSLRVDVSLLFSRANYNIGDSRDTEVGRQ